PKMTQNLVDISDFLQNYMPWLVGGIVALILALILLYRWPPSRLVMDRLALRAPIFGRLLRLAITTQFSHVLSVLLQSGVTLVEGMRALETLFQNRYAARVVTEARAGVLAGGGLAPYLDVPGLFMPMLSRMAAVGESAGTLEEMLAGVARFHEAQ